MNVNVLGYDLIVCKIEKMVRKGEEEEEGNGSDLGMVKTL